MKQTSGLCSGLFFLLLQFYAQNELILNVMPATGLTIVGTGACSPWCSISSSFQNSLKTYGHRGYEFMGFCCLVWNLAPFLPDRCPAAEEFVVIFDIVCLMMHQMLSVGERSGLQAGQFSIWTLLLRSPAVVIAAVYGFALSCWNRRRLEGSMCCSKPFIYLSAFIVPSKTCKLPTPFALMPPHTIRDAGFWTERW